MKYMKNLLLAGLLACLIHSHAFAQHIYWNFATATPTTNSTTNVTSSALSSGNSNGNTTLISTTSVSSGYPGVSGSQNAGVAARIGAIDTTSGTGSAFFEVTLTASGSSGFSLNGVSLGSRSTSTGPKAFTIRSGADGFASDLITPVTLSSNSTWALHNVTLTTPLSVTTSVTIRIYGYNGSGSPSTGTVNWRIDDLTLTFSGTPPAPSIPPVSNLVFSDIQTTSVKLGFTKSGSYVDSLHQVLVFLKQDAPVNQDTPTSGSSSYTPETNFQLASSAYEHDAAAFCVMNSDQDSVVITNLVPGKTYYALAYVVRSSDSAYSAAATSSVMTTDTAPPPPAPEYPLYDIGQISQTNMTTGEPDSMDVKVMLRGIATGFNQRTAGISFVLTDATGGTTLFHPSKTFNYTVNEGDSIYVKGVVTTFRGLHEINIDTLWTGGPASVTLTPVVVPGLDETTENRLVRLNNVRFATPPAGSTFGTASANYPIVTANNDTFTLRVLSTSALAGQALPSTPTFNVIGLGVQYSTSPASPYAFNGYQIFPRRAADIIEVVPPPVPRPVPIGSINQTNMSTGNPEHLGDTVFLRGIALGFNQRTAGLLFVIDDGTGGISLFHSSRSFGYTVQEGDSIYAKGIIGTFRGLTQVVLDTLWQVGGTSPVYSPVTVSSLNESTENRLVRLNGVRFLNPPSGSSWPSSSDNIHIVTPANETFVIRVVSTSGLAGTPLPSTETFDIIGLQGQFSPSTSAPFASDGYQIFPRTTGDVIEIPDPQPADSIGAFSLLSVTDNTLVSVDSPYTGSFVISWNRPELFGTLDSVWYRFELDTVGGNFSSTPGIFSGNGDPDDTSFVLSENTIKNVLDDLGVTPGQTWYGRWRISAAAGSVATISSQTFNITFDYVLSSGLNDAGSDAKLLLYPNPATHVLNLEHASGLERVDVYSHTGQKVLTRQLDGLTRATLDIRSLAKGLYFITVHGKDGSPAVRKIRVE